MATPLAEAFVRIRPDTANFARDARTGIDRAGRDLTNRSKRLGAGMSKSIGSGFRVGIGGAAKTIFAPIAAAAAAVGGFNLFKGFIADARESAKVSRLTAQVIKSTGGAANVSAKQVDALAQALSNKTAVDDELVQTGANLLLTFKNVRNEAGKGNDIFNQATAAALDLSAAGFGSVESASKMLGKALNDPLKGLTALGRAGVTFTEQQKEQIKTLVESGDVLGAQRIIMEEIASQVGGAAEAAADPMQKLRVIVENLGERIGTALLPFIEDAAEWLGEHLPRALDTAGRFFSEHIMPRLREFGEFFKNEILPRLKEFGAFIRDEVVPRLQDLGGWISRNRDFVIPFVAALGTGVIVFKAVVAITKAWAIAQGILNAVLFANPIGLIIAAIAALAAGLVFAYQKSETFRDIVDGVFDFIADSASSLWNDFLKPVFDAFGAALIFIGDTAESMWNDFLKPTFDFIGTTIDFLWNDIIKPAFTAWINLWLTVVDTILQGAEQAFGWVPGLGEKLDDAHDAFEEFRRDVNRELNNIADENIKINVGYAVSGSGLPVGVSRGGSGGAGGRGGGGAFSGIAARDMAAMGGDLDLETLGLNPKKIAGLATDFVSRTKAAIMKAAKAAAATMTQAGKFVFPLPRGSYRVGVPINGYPGHTGQDFPAPTGTPVFAPFSGYMLARNLGNRSYGRFADISAGVWRSIQAHLSGFARGSGPVHAGQLIGYVGSTGNSTGPHLHQEFRRNGVVINPRSVLSYARGGLITEPVAGVGLRSGRGYTLAENGPERVTPGEGSGITKRELRGALEGMTFILEDRRGQSVARLADLYGRAG